MTSKKPKIVVLTGATDGMGRVVAPKLAAAGYFVIAQGRDARRGRSLVDEILKSGGQARFMACDLASLKDVKRFAEDVNASVPHINVLLNNAGIGTGPDGAPREVSADGFERRFAVNYLAHYFLIKLFIGKLAVAAPSRIVNVASDGQEPIDFSDVMLEKMYSGYYAYCRSKVAEVMMTIDFADELKNVGVTVNTMHPGSFMDTTMVRQMNHAVVESLDAGATYLFELATHPKYDGVNGRYFNRGADTPAKEQCYDPSARKQLRDISEKLIGPFL